jgi:membrane associated rhomboid family serine protease
MYREEWNRDDGPHRDGGPFALTPWVRRLIVANAAVFLLNITVLSGPWLADAFGFSARDAWLQPWTFVSYLFVHSGFLHLGMNMVGLFFFGPPVEERLGSSSFARYFFFCGVGGAILSLALAFIWTPGIIVGASGAVFGVALAFAIFWPDFPIILFPLPFPIKAKYLVAGYATLDLILQILPGSDGVAHLAHLGGLLFGLLYLKGLPYLAQRTTEASDRKKEAVSVLVQPTPRSAEAQSGRARPQPASSSPIETEDAVVDRILDKISVSGMDSLTEAERRILDDRSQKLKGH